MRDLFQRIIWRSKIIGDFLKYLWKHKMWWLLPLMIILLLFGLLLILGQTTPLGPFIYTIF
ncbi:MAG: DUF5989 family protein [Candidatus Pacearchaeota archaeon]